MKKSSIDKNKLTLKTFLDFSESVVSFREAFEKTLRNFSRNQSNNFGLLEAIILSCILVESILKEELKKISPALIMDKIDHEHIAIISNKRKKLLIASNKEISDFKTANISVLLERYSKFQDISRDRTYLESLLKMRNKVIHSAGNVVLNENEISVLLLKFIFPFVHRYIDVSERIWREIEKISRVSGSRFKRNLLRTILGYREGVENIRERDFIRLVNTPAILEESNKEVFRGESLVCPACQFESMDLISGIEVTFSSGEYNPHPYSFGKCRICSLFLEEFLLREILENKDEYFSLTQIQEDEWVSALFPDNSESQ